MEKKVLNISPKNIFDENIANIKVESTSFIKTKNKINNNSYESIDSWRIIWLSIDSNNSSPIAVKTSNNE